MFRRFAAAAACAILATGASASVYPLDLVLRVETTKLSDVEILDSNYNVAESFEFLDHDDDTLGDYDHPFDFRHSVGDEVSFSAIFGEPFGFRGPGNMAACDIGTYSCFGAYGSATADTFSLGDGAGSTAWGDFYMSGGTQVGDTVTLHKFEGGRYYSTLESGAYFSWDTNVSTFTVVQSSVAIAPMPVPASMAFLVAGLAGIGWVGRRRRKA